MFENIKILHSSVCKNKDKSLDNKYRYEDICSNNDFIFISKPSGLLVHSAPYMENKIVEENLVQWIVEKFPQTKNVGDDTKYRPGIVHRLDKDTSGIMVIALNQNTFLYLKKLFSEHKIKKTYKAIISGKIDNNCVVNMPIGIKKGTIKRTVFSNKMAKSAITEFVNEGLFEKNGDIFSFVSVYPYTGRTHQIRVHSNYIHHPIIGDSLYGGKKNKECASRLMLHAYSIEFRSQKGELIYCKTQLPDDFTKFLPTDFNHIQKNK